VCLVREAKPPVSHGSRRLCLSPYAPLARGHRWVFEPALSSRIPITRTDVDPTKKAYNFARSFSTERLARLRIARGLRGFGFISSATMRLAYWGLRALQLMDRTGTAGRGRMLLTLSSGRLACTPIRQPQKCFGAKPTSYGEKAEPPVRAPATAGGFAV